MENKKKFIRKVFNTIADDYDRMNFILTGGFFSLWQKKLMKEMAIESDNVVIDVCCGSGELTLKISDLLDNTSGGSITGIDFSENMLEVANLKRIKNKKSNVKFYRQDALHLEFSDQIFDKAVNAFALRNLENIDMALSEMHRVLKKNGTLFVMEVSKPENSFIGFFFEIYYYKIVPLIGKISDKGKKLEGKYSPYEWLSQSLKEFPEKKIIISKFYKAGFTDLKVKTLGFGGISMYIARK